MDGRSTRSNMIGQSVAMPVAIAPTGLAGMQHAEGEILAAKAAERFGIPFTLSTMSICSIEDVAAHTTAPFWFQLYADTRSAAQGHQERSLGATQAHAEKHREHDDQAALVHGNARYLPQTVRQYRRSCEGGERHVLARCLDQPAI